MSNFEGARIELTDAELQMIECLREAQGEVANFRLVIERTDGRLGDKDGAVATWRAGSRNHVRRSLA